MAEKRKEDEFFPEASKPVRDLLLNLHPDSDEDGDIDIEAFKRFAWFPKLTSEQLYNFKHDEKITLKDLKPPKIGRNVATMAETWTFIRVLKDFFLEPKNGREHSHIPIRRILLIHSALVDAGKFTLDSAYGIFDWLMNKDWHLEWKLEQHRRFKTPLDILYVKLLEDFEVEMDSWTLEDTPYVPAARPGQPPQGAKRRRCAECNAYHVRRDGEDCPVLKWLRVNGNIVQNNYHA